MNRNIRPLIPRTTFYTRKSDLHCTKLVHYASLLIHIAIYRDIYFARASFLRNKINIPQNLIILKVLSAYTG